MTSDHEEAKPKQQRPGRVSGRALGIGLLVVGAALVLVAGGVAIWGGDETKSTENGSTTAASDTSSPSGRRPIPGYGFGEVAVVVVTPDGERRVLCVLEAESAEQRARGLMEIRDKELGGYDGMIFLFPVDSSNGFWMRNTPMPLSIAYLSEDGALVSTADMEPCTDNVVCPNYPADGPYRMALEVPQGRLDDLGVVAGARIEVGGKCEKVQ